MKRACGGTLIVAYALLLAGCAGTDPFSQFVNRIAARNHNSVAEGCAIEKTAHVFYVGFVAPFRPQSAVAFESDNYNSILIACANANLTQLNKAAAKMPAAQQ